MFHLLASFIFTEARFSDQLTDLKFCQSVTGHFSQFHVTGHFSQFHFKINIYFNHEFLAITSLLFRLEDDEEDEKDKEKENKEKEEKDTVYANINQLQKYARDITVPGVFKG